MRRWTVAIVVVALMGLAACNPYAGGQVTIVRDHWGVPHIYSATEEGVAYGEGWAQAEDHYEAMLRLYSQVTGRLSERVGDTAPNRDSDKVARTLLIERTVADRYSTLPSRTRSYVENFVKGVNDWAEAHPGHGVPWAFTVSPVDVVSVGYYAMMGRQFTQSKYDLLGRPGCGPQGCASNGWVLDGSRTASGNVILAADPHVPWYGTNQWWEKHVSTPENEVYGAGLLGMPGVVMGHNRTLAWSQTSTSQDRGDVFELTTCDKGKGYMYEGSCVPFDVYQEPILPSLPDYEVRHSAFGPVFWSDNDTSTGKVYAAGLSMEGQIGTVDQILRINLAGDVDEFADAIAHQQVDGTQYFAGDSSGRIYYGVGARPSIRPPGVDPSKPIPADGDEDRYPGVHRLSELPTATEPDLGYFSGSNAPHYRVDGGAWGIDPKDYPDYVLSGRRDGPVILDHMAVRPQRVADLIEDTTNHTITTAQAIAFDSHVLLADWVLPLLERAVAQQPGGNDPSALAAGLAVLRGWDRVADADATGFPLFLELVRQVNARIETDALLDIREGGRDLVADPNLATDGELKQLSNAFGAAIDHMQTTYHSLEVPWSTINRMVRGSAEVPLGAGNSEVQTIWQGSTSSTSKRTGVNTVRQGSSFMMVTEMGPDGPVVTRSVRPLGQSEDPASPHYADQTLMFAGGTMKTVPWSYADVLAAAESQVSLPLP